MQNNTKKGIWFELFFLIVASLLFFLPIYYVEIFSLKVGDYLEHIKMAKLIYGYSQEIPNSFLVHAGWQWVVKITHAVFCNSWNSSALIITLGSNVISIGIIYWIIRKKMEPLISGALAIGLSLIGPILFLYPIDQKFIGYIWPNVYQNPTFIMLKPLALLQYLFTIRAFQNKNNKLIWSIFIAFVSAFAVYVKPNYALCLLPAIAILVFINILNKQTFNIKEIIYSIVFPSVVVLLWQYIVTYYDSSISNIAIMPFAALGHHSEFLFLKFIFSIIFPITTTICYWKKAIKDITMQLGWLGFFAGAVFTYFLAETGDRLYHVNFLWNGEIALFILFISCVLFLVQNENCLKPLIVKWLILVTGFLHLYSGIVFYISQLFLLLK